MLVFSCIVLEIPLDNNDHCSLTDHTVPLKVVEVEGKGRGVVSTRPFSRGELVCEYSGELISHEEAKRREEEYGRDTAIGCYMYYFTHKTSKLW